MSVLSQPRFHDEAAAFEYLEAMVWANGITCPHCGTVGGRVYKLEGVRSKPSKKNPEGIVRHGLKKCGECRKQFTAKIGTVFEDAKLPLHKMLQAVHLIVSSKKGISSHQLSRILEIQYNSAWFLSHRIREAMRSGDLAPFGGNGTRVEVDETYIGRKKGYEMKPKQRGGWHKMRVVSLVDRASGTARSIHTMDISRSEVAEIVRANVAREAVLTTDESSLYKAVGREYAGHDKVNHLAGEYVRGEITTNTVEGFFSIFKRGMKGVYQHCGEQHLHRYLAEFDFRYNNRVALGVDDKARADRAVVGIVGKRLTYRRPDLNA
jgi:transposase-like protein